MMEQTPNTHANHNEAPCFIVCDSVFIKPFQPLQVILWVTQQVARESHSVANVHCLIVWTISDNWRMLESNCTHTHTHKHTDHHYMSTFTSELLILANS